MPKPTIGEIFDDAALVSASEPVRFLPTDSPTHIEEGMALCLSGGGYRAMLFHTGTLWRLNELGILSQLKRISSVSGGSITSAVLAMNWKNLRFVNGVAENFEPAVVEPIKRLASRSIDWTSILSGILLPGSVGEKVAKRYRKHLFGDTTLQDLPDEPRFVINATSVQSGVLCRFSKPYIWDYRIGKIENPDTSLATAVAASSAFPPLLSPLRLKFDPKQFLAGSGTDLFCPDYQKQLILTDGGVYDNLGLETAWKKYTTILISDAGGGYAAQSRPKRDWIRHIFRVLFTIDNQVRSLRRRQIMQAFTADPPTKKGAFWSIASDFSDGFGVPKPLPCPISRTIELAGESTRLKKLGAAKQMRLINWGYAACDFPIRRYLLSGATPPAAFPYPNVGI